MTTTGARWTLALGALYLASCTVPTAGGGGEAAGERTASGDGFAPGVRVAVTVAGQPDLSGTYRLDRDGRIEMPLLGDVAAYGLTPDELSARLVARLADGYLRDPRVEVATLRPRPFFVLGDVHRPGSYAHRPGMTVAEAIATAGGSLDPDAPFEVVITPAGRERDTRRVDLDRTLMPGDIVALEAGTG